MTVSPVLEAPLGSPHLASGSKTNIGVAARPSSVAESTAVVTAEKALQSAAADARPPKLFMNFGLPALLLAISFVTTMANGARFMQNFIDGLPPVVHDSDLWPWGWLFDNPALFQLGLGFSGSLIGILLLHEFGHYFACRHHKIRSSLPWVLPAPTLSGTAGAIIRVRSRIRDRRALMDVGIYGPLAGFVASVFAVAVGFALSFHRAADAPPALIRFGAEPLAMRIVHDLLVLWDPSIPAFDEIAPHPVLIAGWIGFFITSLNLIPGGQLDGGHILYSFSPRIHRFVTQALPFALFLAGTLYWVGWIVWGVFLMIPAMRHPEVPDEPRLNEGRLLLGAVGLIVFLLTFSLTPFYDSSLMSFFHFDPFKTAP